MRRNNPYKIIVTLIAIILVITLAWTLRWRAATMLPIDYDEDDYLRAGQQFAAIIQKGAWSDFLTTNYRPEHPQLAKIMFGLSIISLPEQPLINDVPITANLAAALPRNLLLAARTMAAVWGTLEVGVLAMINPLAGLFLAIHSFTIKYTGEVMLDGFAALMSMLTAFFYAASKQKKGGTRTGLLIASAIFLGLSASSKYLHAAVGIAILADWYLCARKTGQYKTFFRNAILWGLLAVLVFAALNPYFWPAPLERIRATLEAVQGTTTNPNVARSNYPIWQPLIWLFASASMWHRDIIPFSLDGLILLLACFGLARLWKREPFFVLWLAVGMFFLLVWRTKWPQYILVITAPLSLAAAEGVMALVVQPVKNWLLRRKQAILGIKNTSRNDLKQALPWLAVGFLFFAVLTLFPLIFQVGVSLTDFNSISIRDGLNGGIWREVWGGLSGQIPAAATKFPYRTKEVNYIGPGSYLTNLNTLLNNGTLLSNILWTIVSVALQTALGLGAALLLWQRGIKFRRGWEMLFILPWAIPEMIGAQMWMNVFAPTIGWLSLAVLKYGNDIPFAFLLNWDKSADIRLVVLLIAATWYGFPFLMLATRAGLNFLPAETLDSAHLDGANSWQTFRLVIWPLLMPLLLPAIIIRGIFAFNQFYLFQTFRISNGTLATLSYNYFNTSGFSTNGQFAVSAVINIITIFILIGLVSIFNRWSKAGKGVTYA